MGKLTQMQSSSFQSRHLKVSELLDACLYAFFPDEVYILNNLKGLTQKDKIFVNYYNKAFLAYHTRDSVWLAHMLDQVYYNLQCVHNSRVHSKSQITAKRLPISYILNYIENSPKFDTLRCQYEQNLVKAYITLTRDVKKDDFFMKSLTKTTERYDQEYDNLFRERVMGAMNYLGVDLYNAEIGIESNRNLWQGEVMAQTFANIYNTVDANKLLSPHGLLAKELPAKRNKLVYVADKLYASWSILRQAKYNEVHREVVDRVGIYNTVRLSPEKLKKLTNEVESLGFEYECLLADAQQSVESVNKKVNKLGFDIKIQQ